MTDSLHCPRCGGLVPNDREPGAYAGGVSRADNRTMICTRCEEHEALQGPRRGSAAARRMAERGARGVTPVEDWPLTPETLTAPVVPWWTRIDWPPRE